MKGLVLLATTAVMIAVLAIPAGAQTQPNAVIALHVKSHAAKAIDICDAENPNTNSITCDTYSLTGGLNTALDAYLVVALADPGTGIGGLSCGIDYDATAGSGVGVFGWTLCADLDFPNAGANGLWPASGGGNRITFETTGNCQRTVFTAETGVHAVAGAFYVYAYSPDLLVVTPNNNLASGPELRVADCDAAETELNPDTQAAKASFGGAATEFNPCMPDPVEPTTWGKIKAGY